MATGNFFVEASFPGQRPFIAGGDMLEHNANYWRDEYAHRYPAASFTVKKHGGFICRHGAASRDFCKECEG